MPFAAPDDRTLAFLHELEQADEAVGAVLAELDGLAEAVERVRSRAVELEVFLTRLPAERERASAALAASERAAVTGREEVARAERELAEAGGGRERDREAAARRDIVRARDALRMSERRVEQARQAVEELEVEAAAAARETGELEREAASLAEALRGRPRLADQAGESPGPGLAGVAEWGSRARAALFVARGGLVSEREAVIRQANELGSLVLGEPLSAASAATVVRRVEKS